MRGQMNVFYLILAILFEVAGTTSLKFSQGFTRIIPSVILVLCYGMSFWMLSLTLKKIEVGIAYAVWSALGTALITAIGILWFKEPITIVKIASIALIILGVVGLNLGGGSH